MNMVNWLKRVKAIRTTDTSNLVKKIDYDTKLVKFKKNTDMVIVISILLHKNLTI